MSETTPLNPNPLSQESIEASSIHQHDGSGTAPFPSDPSVFKPLVSITTLA